MQAGRYTDRNPSLVKLAYYGASSTPPFVTEAHQGDHLRYRTRSVRYRDREAGEACDKAREACDEAFTAPQFGMNFPYAKKKNTLTDEELSDSCQS